MEKKDIQRIKDIITKSKGDKKKAIQLAQTMANKITDSSKAIRRALAAEEQGRNDLGKIFRKRANTILGIDIKSRLKDKVSKAYDY